MGICQLLKDGLTCRLSKSILVHGTNTNEQHRVQISILIYISYINVPSMSWNHTIWAIATTSSLIEAWYLKLPFTAENRNRPAQIITALKAKPTSWEVLNLKQFTNPSNCGAIVAGETLPGTQSKVGFCLVLRSQTLYLPLGWERVWWY